MPSFKTLSSAEINGNLTVVGSIRADEYIGLSATDVTYDNEFIRNGVGLDSKNVQDAIDELEIKKLNIRDAGTNLVLFATTASSDISGYNALVCCTSKPQFDTIAVDVSTGPVGDTNTLVGQLASRAGVLVGAPGIVNITTIGNIRKVSGNRDAVFFFEVYKRDIDGVEVFLTASDPTPSISSTEYRQFSEFALLPINTVFLETDRIVIKYYGRKNETGGVDPVYEFQFGGVDPVRTLFPVPASVTILETWRKENDDIYYNLGNVGIGTISPTEKLEVNGNVKISGHISAATKSFLIPNPKTGGKLQYGVIESNEHAVYIRGETSESVITLPDHWEWLVHEDSVTVVVSPVGRFQSLFVISKDNRRVVIGGNDGVYDYVIYGRRKDVEDLKVDWED